MQGQVRPHKTLKCVILEPGPGAEVKIAKPGPGKQYTMHRPLRHRHLVSSESDQNPQSNAKVACCLVTLSRRNTGTGRLRAWVRLRHRFKCHLSVEGNEAFLLWV